ncbi:MAG: SpoIVB peptidase [Clostridia bacterium]|jgi:stage IV sporulation protein B|nr:SpoIVB peptidase [Clostridia bacterium]MDH7572678.1 SpoIVB peptidase [Clostridia bacterium]
MPSGKGRTFWLFSALLAAVLFFSYALYSVPEEQRLGIGEEVRLELALPARLLSGLGRWQPSDGVNWPVATRPGSLHLRLELLGLIPVRTVTVHIVEPPEVVPGGHCIGVLLRTSGAVVVGFAPITSGGGETVNPAREAGFVLGDTITRIDGHTVAGEDQVAYLVDRAGRAGKTVRVTVRRGGELKTLVVRPLFCRETGRYRIGLYVRDSAAGVGTLTFYLPREKVFAALGHMVVDSNSEPVPLADGRIVGASVQGIQQARQGRPGEKIGLFLDRTDLQGSILRNTRFGIFGSLDRLPRRSLYRQPVPVALAHQVHSGRAEMLTVINGEEIERFEVEIERVMPQQREDGRGLLLRVTDPRLLALTGGIVQGMSGSPILQDGTLVGAVTHVFVHDPTRGYGVLAEWMLAEMGLFGRAEVEKPKRLTIGGL